MIFRKNKERAHSGFTLIEMVVVIAIISILLLTLVPAMYNYYTNSRLKSANSDAKVLFNSAQTIMQEYEFSERSAKDSFFYGHNDSGTHTGTLMLKGKVNSSGKGVIYQAAVNGAMIFTSETDANAAGYSAYRNEGGSEVPNPASFGGRLVRLYPDFNASAWCIYIENYSVRCVVAASKETSDYVGGYPIKADVKNDVDVIGTSTVSSVTVSDMQSYGARCWP